ncbi:MAG: SUMF1/EgtB/PvdO family nonheme iron enzyme [Planctomycetes bacterium]|nr:SUMF1/EgtB/PvdO family nonheme iron enzyme [Planctomycetota bacterium]
MARRKPARSSPQYAVFVSSTFLDNIERRELVIDAIQRAGMRPVGMEWFTSASRPTAEMCCEQVQACDVLVGIIAYRYGWEPPGGGGKSITELEYDAARERLMFLVDERAVRVDHTRDIDEGDDRWDKQKKLDAFKRKIRRDVERTAAPFTDKDLGVQVLQALNDWRTDFEARGGEPRTSASDSASTVASLAELRDYIQRLARLNDSVSVVGFGQRVRGKLKLEDLHVDLTAVADLKLGGDSDFADAQDAVERMARHGSHCDLKLSEAFSFASERERSGLALLGDPGSGKTTHMKRIVLQLAERDGAKSLGLPADVVPVLVLLRHLADAGGDMGELVRQSIEQPELGFEPGTAQRLLARDNVLYLLDGLDEVKSGAERDGVSRWIERTLKRHSGRRCVLTCRYAGYKRGARLDAQFLELHLRPLSPEQTTEFIAQWFETVERCENADASKAAREAQRHTAALTKRLNEPEFRSARVAELKRNPLLLSSICLVHRDKGELPKHRAKLYDECIAILLERWRDGERGRVSIEADRARAFLCPMAFFLHRERGRTRATAKQLEPIVAAAMQGVAGAPSASALLESVRDECGLLTGWSGDVFGFMHLGFQEYLAAHDILKRGYGDPAPLRELAKHFGEDWWQEVTLLLLAIGPRAAFETLMKAVLARPDVLKREELLRLCLTEAGERSAKPFEAVLKSRKSAPALRELVWRLLNEVDPATAKRYAPPEWQQRIEIGAAAAARGAPTVEVIRKRFVDLEFAKLRLALIPAGKFTMGSPESERGRQDTEGPQHEVTLTRDFHLSVTTVTNAQYELYLHDAKGAKEPALWSNRKYNQPQQPVVGVSWGDARAYCEWATRKLAATGDRRVVRLPTEAEWEYACRAETTSRFWSGDGDPDLERVGWFGEGPSGAAHPVGEKPANSFGLFDMHGNVWEWCSDWFGTYAADRQVDPAGPKTGSARVLRGGSFWFIAVRCRSAARFRLDPGYRLDFFGFRVALCAPPSSRASTFDL